MALKSLKTKDRMLLSLVSFIALFLSFNQQAYAMELVNEDKKNITSFRNSLRDGLYLPTCESVENFVRNKLSLTELSLVHVAMKDEGIEALSTLSSLTVLDLSSNEIGNEGVKLLTDVNSSLRSLSLRNNKKIGDEGIKALTSGLTSLTSLELGLNAIGPKGLITLGRSNLPLKTLKLYSLPVGANELRLFASGSLTSLTTLDLLSCNEIGAKEVQALNSGNLSLTSLDLYGNQIGAKGIKTLNTGPLISLTSLNLGMNEIGPAGVKALPDNLSFLTLLDLDGNQIGDPGVKTLAAFNLSLLTNLNLGSNQIGPKGARALASANTPNLTSLNLSSNGIGPEGARALTFSVFSLTYLDLYGNGIGPSGIETLVSSGKLSFLTSLILADNAIGDKGVRTLASDNFSSSLTSLSLDKNKIGALGLQILVTSGKLTSLTTLDLGRNEIKSSGGITLASNNFPFLKSLGLLDNQIGDEGAKAFLRSNKLPSLTELDLRQNPITQGYIWKLDDKYNPHKYNPSNSIN